MVKITQPLMSGSASGTIAKTLTYSHRKSGRQVRSYNKPLAPPSAKQRGQRRLTEFLVAQWQNMSAGTKADWTASAKAAGVNLPGYQYFLREAQRDLYTHHGLCAYWHCNEIVGGQILDLSGRNNHGTLEPNYPSNAPTLVDSKANRFGKALHFDGSDDVVNCGNPADLAFLKSGIFAIFFLFRVPSLSEDFLFNKHEEVTSGWGLKVLSSGALRFIDDRDEWDHSINSNLKITANVWADICVTFNNETIKFYINGALSTTWQDGPMVFTNDVTSDFEFSNSKGWSEFLGEMDEVCYYNREPSAAEILTRHNFSKTEVPS